MHYKNGRLAEIGDAVYGNPYPSDPKCKAQTFIVTRLYPGSPTCNIIVTRGITGIYISGDTLFAPKPGMFFTSDSKNFLHIDDYLDTIVPRVIEGEEVPQI